jgi:heme/copper-type cytochrome/quinol oxidase subunit 2
MQSAPVLIALLIVVCGAATVAACPTCANGMAGDSAQHQARIDGYFYSILLMMAMPFLLIGGFATYMYLEVRKARARQLSEQAESRTEEETVES